jgi:protein ImuB
MPDAKQVMGEVSGPAEAFGVHSGMRLSEALARCPDLRLVAADPDGAAAAWISVLERLEGIGAAVESPRPGEAYFDAEGLRRLYGGRLEGVVARARKAVSMAARFGWAPSRFCAYAIASRARPGRKGGAEILLPAAARAFLAPLPVGLLRARPEIVELRGRSGTDLPTVLDRLGIRTLGELAALSEAMVADRFGTRGLRAHELARGLDTPLRPRRFVEELVERIDLPEAVSGFQLERMLELLVDRLLARPERRGRAFRKLRLGARFVEQGTWRREVTLRQATATHDRLRLALTPKLTELPAPIEQLSLGASEFGPPTGEQLGFRHADESERRKRLGEALRQTRAVAGADSVLRVLEVDPSSRIPERRAVLTPFPE